MENKNLIIAKPISLFLLIGIIIFGCQDPNELQDLPSNDPYFSSNQTWQELLGEVDAPSVVIVQNENSIQQALSVAGPEEVVVLETGVYRESGKNVQLLGLQTEFGEGVILENPVAGVNINFPNGVELRNIELINYKRNQLKSSGLSKGRMGNNRRIQVHREVAAGNIAHYTFSVRTGRGKYDRFTLHRLIAENKPYHPSATQSNIFLTHGANQNFEDIYLEPGTMDLNSGTSIAMYLASNGVDVWGIDLGWTHVPEGETDFAFFENWGVDRDVNDILKGMSLARLIRGITKQSFGRMNLLGFSYSVALAYVAAGYETQQHRMKRDISGLIVVDGQLKYDPADQVAINNACIAAQNNLDALNSGIFNTQNGVFIFGELAAQAPSDPSPIIPGLTNFQAALFVGANTYQLLPGAPNPYWHFTAGIYDNGIPVDLAYSLPDRWISALSMPHAGPYMPIRVGYELNSCQCGQEDSPLDDYLSEIQVPALYLGAGGGTSSQGYYSVDQLGSANISKHIVSLNPDPALDFGHGDLFFANNADSEVWEMIRQWVMGVSI